MPALVLQAREDALSVETFWRVEMHNMPITDPRFLCATQEQIYYDLLVHQELARLRKEAKEPEASKFEQDKRYFEANPDRLAQIVEESEARQRKWREENPSAQDSVVAVNKLKLSFG